MEKRDPYLPKLTQNDKTVLKKILGSKKVADSDIAKSLNLSPQAIFKIRSKLENRGIIKGYMPIVDFEKIGINVVIILIVRLTSKVWERFTDDQITEKIAKTPYVMGAYRVTDEQASHVLILGFKDTEQKESYVAQIQTKYAEDIVIKEVYTFPVTKIISQSPLGLLREMINQKEFSPKDLFLNHNS